MTANLHGRVGKKISVCYLRMMSNAKMIWYGRRWMNEYGAMVE